MSNVITDAMNIATENQHKIDNLYGVLNNYKLSKKNKGYENDHSNKSLKDIKEVLTSTDMGEVANTTAEAEPTDLVFGAKSPVVYKEELGDLEATYNTIPGSVTSTSTVVYAACNNGNGTIVVLPIQYNRSKKEVGAANKLYYSTNDGITWNSKLLPTSGFWHDVCYGGGKFVAISGGTFDFRSQSQSCRDSVCIYSVDGITWSKATMPATQYWNTICYGGGKFVAIGGSWTLDTYAYSSDGITWTQGTMPRRTYWHDMCYGKDKFIVSSVNRIAYSSDGITWAMLEMPKSNSYDSICYGNGIFVCAGDVSNGFAYSSDGITWTASKFNVTTKYGDATNLHSIKYINDKFIAGVTVSKYSEFPNKPRYIYSSDGITWEYENSYSYSSTAAYASRLTMFEYYNLVVPTSTGFMLFGASDSEIQYWKVDEVVKPIAFKQGNLLSINYWSCICYGKDKFVAIASSNIFAYSSDGITWTQGTMPVKGKWRSVCYGKDKFVAVIDSSNTFVYSSDGITWTQGTMLVSARWSSVCYGKDKFVVVARNTDKFAYSLDGITWTKGTLPSSKYWESVCYGKDKFVVVADNTNIFAYSSDGITWTQGTMPSTQKWWSVCYGKDKFVAIVYNSDVFAYSTDGITWTQGTLPSTQYWRSICYGKDKFVAIVYNSDVFVYSLDGITWTQGNTPSAQKWICMCYGKDKFVAVESVSNSNAFVYSYDLPTYNNYAYQESALPADIGLSRNIEYEFTEAGFKTGSMASKPSSSYWQSVCYGNGKFVALSGGPEGVSNIFAYSLDGIAWTKGTLPVNRFWYSVCYGKDKFVAVANDSNIIAYSLDGITWTSGTLPSGQDWSSVCYGKDKFVAIATATEYNTFACFNFISPVSINGDIYQFRIPNKSGADYSFEPGHLVKDFDNSPINSIDKFYTDWNGNNFHIKIYWDPERGLVFVSPNMVSKLITADFINKNELTQSALDAFRNRGRAIAEKLS